MLTFRQIFAALSPNFPQMQANLANAVGSFDNVPFSQFCSDSRDLAEGEAFILLKSQSPTSTPQDITPADIKKYSQYLLSVADKAVLILSEIDPRYFVNFIQQHSQIRQPIIYVPDIRNYLGTLIQTSLPLKKSFTLPKIIATTGTNGKTTVSQLIAQIVSRAEQKTAVMGTAGNGILVKNQPLNLTPATHTTLEVANLQQAIYDFAQQNVQVLSIEASSHGLYQQRLQGVPITVAVYTNLSRDHLDYHSDMDEYATAKARLFDKGYFPTLTHAIINCDDEFSELMIKTAKASNLTVWTYSLTDPTAEFFAQYIAPSLEGVALSLATPFGDMTVKSPLLGRFNVANLLASIAGALALGLTLEQIAQAVPNLQGAVGRMEKVPALNKNQACFIVDYAHTPDALAQVLTSLKSHCEGELWAVFGCGGDRDKGKRPLMTQVALDLADKVILTADNPRTEDPLAILSDMQAGMSDTQYAKTFIEPDRKLAIAYAVQHAKPNDIVVIAGKGHETYQEINGVRHDFDDRAEVKMAMGNISK